VLAVRIDVRRLPISSDELITSDGPLICLFFSPNVRREQRQDKAPLPSLMEPVKPFESYQVHGILSRGGICFVGLFRQELESPTV
jgi:hypothetical protein